MRPSSATDFCRPSTVTRSRAASRWRSNASRKGCPVFVKRSERASASVVQPVLVFFVLGMPSCPKRTSCSCLGEPRLILLAADGVPRVLLGLRHLGGEVLLERVESVDVDGDAGALHAGEHVDERQLDVGEQLGAAGRGHLLVEDDREVAHGRGPHHLLLGRDLVGVAAEVEHALAVGGRRPRELAVQLPQHEVVEVVGALVGLDEVGRELGVARQAGERPAARGQRLDGTLGVVHGLGSLGVLEPGTDAPARPRASGP